MECTVNYSEMPQKLISKCVLLVEMSENEVDRVDKHVEVWYKVSLCVGRVAV